MERIGEKCCWWCNKRVYNYDFHLKGNIMFCSGEHEEKYLKELSFYDGYDYKKVQEDVVSYHDIIKERESKKEFNESK